MSEEAMPLKPTMIAKSGEIFRLEIQDGSATAVYHGPKQMVVLISMEETPVGNLPFISVSYPNRVPKYEELIMVKETFFPVPDQRFMTLLPVQTQGRKATGYEVKMWLWPFRWGEGD